MYGIVSGWMLVVGVRLKNKYGVGNDVGLFVGDAIDVYGEMRVCVGE